MGIAQIPAGSSGLSSAIKSIQRGTAASAGNISITTVDTTKTVCNSFSTSSTGTVAATGTVSAATGSASSHSSSSGSITLPFGQAVISGYTGPQYLVGGVTSVYNNWNSQTSYFSTGGGSLSALNLNSQNVSLNSTSISGGTTNLTTAVYGVYLVNATTIYATGPCRYEVVEYY